MVAARVASSLHLVVPCFNERTRLAVDQIGVLTADDRVSLVLVDDGSTDRTLDLLRSIERDTASVTVIALPRNGGKGEAVRAGLASALAADPSWLGYVDADMATPASEILRLLDVAAGRPGVDVVLGSRAWRCSGRDVQRSAFRHYTGRVFATLASLVLAKAVYDTQCGAKLFRRTNAFDRSIVAPFRSRWAFDVELLGRLESAGVEPSRYWEEPLLVWHDISGSRRTVRQSIGAAAELLPIWRDLRRARPMKMIERLRANALTIAVIVLSVIAHTWELGRRPMAHDEAIDAWFSWQARGTGIIKYDPVYHGPLRFYLEGFVLDHFGTTPGWTRRSQRSPASRRRS